MGNTSWVREEIRCAPKCLQWRGFFHFFFLPASFCLCSPPPIHTAVSSPSRVEPPPSSFPRHRTWPRLTPSFVPAPFITLNIHVSIPFPPSPASIRSPSPADKHNGRHPPPAHSHVRDPRPARNPRPEP